MMKGGNFVFRAHIEYDIMYKPTHMKLTLKWAWSGSLDLNLKFVAPSITFERISYVLQILCANTVLETLCRQITPKKARCLGHVTNFEIFGHPLYFWND